jgi:hypothetical protein
MHIRTVKVECKKVKELCFHYVFYDWIRILVSKAQRETRDASIDDRFGTEF